MPKRAKGKTVRCRACGREFYVGGEGFEIVDDEPRESERPRPAKSKSLAGVFALVFGMLGVHEFYLERTGHGFAILGAWVTSLAFTVCVPVLGALMFLLLAVVVFVQALVILTMSDEAFERDYCVNVSRHD